MSILLIWDIDGTLINCKGVGRKALNDAFLKMFGIKSGFDGVSMSGRLDERIVRDAMRIHGIDLSSLNDFYKAYGESLLHQMEIHKPYVHDGVQSILEETSLSGQVLNAIGTGNCQVGAQMKLKFTGLDHFMKLGGYGSDHEKRDTLIKDVINQAHKVKGTPFDKNKIFVIGDTPRDIIAGQKNKVKTIALETGGYTASDLGAFDPDFVLPSLLDKEAFYRAIELSVSST